MIKAIFFDIGGVICAEGFKPSFKKYGDEFNIPEKVIYNAIHEFQGWKDFTLGKISEKDFFEMCQKRMPASFELDVKRYSEIVDELYLTNDEIVELIKNDLSKRYIIGIISNLPREWFERIMVRTGLGGVLKVVAVSCYEHVRKPNIAIFKSALNRAGVEPGEAVFVDDRDDVVGEAKNLGIRMAVFDGDIQNFKNLISNLK